MKEQCIETVLHMKGTDSHSYVHSAAEHPGHQLPGWDFDSLGKAPSVYDLHLMALDKKNVKDYMHTSFVFH